MYLFDANNKLKVPIMLEFIKATGSIIELST